jgi:hypothetical protein
MPSQDPSTIHIGCGLATAAQLSTGLAALESKVNASMKGLPVAAQVNSSATDAALLQLQAALAALQARLDALKPQVASANATLQQLAAATNAEVALLKAAEEQLAANATAEIAAIKSGLQLLAANTTAEITSLQAGLKAINVSDFVRVGTPINAATLGGVAPNGYVRVPTQVVLFALPDRKTGSLGGRAGADALCQSATSRPPGYLNARAFLSFYVVGSATGDAVKDMPTNYGVPTNLPIVSANNILLAANWAALLSGSPLNTSFVGAGVVPSAPPNYLETYFWFGTYADGQVASNQCAGWTSAAGSDYGRTGVTLSASLGDGVVANCYNALHVFCLAF